MTLELLVAAAVAVALNEFPTAASGRGVAAAVAAEATFFSTRACFGASETDVSAVPFRLYPMVAESAASAAALCEG